MKANRFIEESTTKRMLMGFVLGAAIIFEATAADLASIDLGPNLALASQGSTITGSNGGDWSNLIDGVTTGYSNTNGYGYTFWTGVTNAPGSMTLDLKRSCIISNTKLLLWDLDSRYYQYKIEASSNNTTWTTIVDRTAVTNQCQGWQDSSFSPNITAQYLRLIGTYNIDNVQFHVVEWEVYGLPVVAILTSTNAVTVPEDGTVNFDVKLSAMPAYPMTVTVSRASGDMDLDVLSGSTLVFDATNWNTNQTVTLSAASDADQLNGSALIQCSIEGVTNTDVTATEADNTPGLSILTSANAVSVPEGGTTNFGVKLNTEPVSPTTVTVSRASGDTNIAVQTGSLLVFDAANWNANQTVTLSASSDADQLNGSAVIRCSIEGLTTNTDVMATEADNTPGLSILTSANAVSVPEGGTTNFGVKLNTEPVSPTTVTVSRASGDTNIAVQTGSLLVFDAANWNANQTVTLSASSDADQLNGSAVIRCSIEGLTTNTDVMATEADNTPGLSILTSANAVSVPEGGTTNFGVKLNTEPVSPTTVTVSRASGDTNIAVQTGSLLVFDAANWNANQTVTLSASSDADQLNGSAVIRCSIEGLTTNTDVMATEADNTPGLSILTSANAVSVPEGETTNFGVKLNTEPVSPTTVTVSRASGDTNIAVESGSLLVFDATNWNANQTVTLSASSDADQLNGSAVIRCSIEGLTNTDVTATEADNTPGEVNLALASRGSTITGNNGTNWNNLIDGVTTGYGAATGFGYTFWKDAVNAPGNMTLDLKGLCTISSMNLLLWDLDGRYYQYLIQASTNNATWTTIVDRRTGTWQSWQNIVLSPTITARYLRVIGTYDSDDSGDNNGFHVVEWQVYGAPPTPAILTSTNAVIVPIGVTATFKAKLNAIVISPTTVTVSRLSGDTNIVVQSGGSLVFDSSNWDTYQPVTLQAGPVTPTNASAVIRCSAPGMAGTDVTARALYNLALASRGSTITGNNGTNWNNLIDGVTTGYGAATGFGYTFWKDAVNAPGNMTLDLKGLCTISSMNLLLWDLDGRYYQYLIQASTNNATWTTIVDRRTGTWQSWQNIVLSPTITARYLRVIGTYDSDDSGDNNGFHVVEWQVYGTPPPPPVILTSANAVTVPERSTAKFQVQLNSAPVSPTTVSVSRVSGDTNLTVLSGGSLVFSASNWDIYQPVTLGAAADADTTNSSAVIRCSAPNTADKDVTATNQDTDVFINLALASRGSTITGSNGANWDKLIDGATTGYDSGAGYGYTLWTNVPAPGTMTVDLKNLCIISSMRLLLWDGDSRHFRYKIEASSDNTAWTTIVDRTAATNQCQSWQDISFTNPPIQARYLKLTGTFKSPYSSDWFEVVEWEVYGKTLAILTSANAVTVPERSTAKFQVQLNSAPVSPTTVSVSRVSGDTNLTVQSGGSLVFSASNWDIYQPVTLGAAADADTTNSSAVIRCSAPNTADKDVTATNQDTDVFINLALASRGSTITGSNGANWDKLIDGDTTSYATGSVLHGYGYTLWKDYSNAPGTMTVDLKNLCIISSMRLLLWDRDSRYYQYKIEASSNNATWTTIVDRTAATNQCQSWQDISFTNPPIQARYLRLTGTFKGVDISPWFEVVEWEVYGIPSAPPVTYTITPVAGANGSISPHLPVTLDAGQSTSLVVSANPSYYIASVATNGAPVSRVAGLYVYTSWWNNVQADGTITAAFASVTGDTATNGTQIPWLRQYYTNAPDLDALKALANEDTDGDGMVNWREFWSKTDPTESNKFLRFTSGQYLSDSTGSVIRWTSETGIVYRLKRSTNLITDLFTTIVQTNITATPPINVTTDMTDVGTASWYYRVSVEH